MSQKQDTNNGYFQLLTGQWVFQISDNATMNEHPSASTDMILNASITLPSGFETRTQAVFLGGFNISMACVNTSTSTCNSNAAWAYQYNISLLGCQPSDVSQESLDCSIRFVLARGWTPDRGGGLLIYSSFLVNVYDT